MAETDRVVECGDCGWNKATGHQLGAIMTVGEVAAVRAGDECPDCGMPLRTFIDPSEVAGLTDRIEAEIAHCDKLKNYEAFAPAARASYEEMSDRLSALLRDRAGEDG